VIAPTVTTRFRCMECGKDCEPREFHDYAECIRYRWTKAPRAADNGAGELRQAERDIESLLALLDAFAPAPRRYP
jgi:hypothetical protein